MSDSSQSPPVQLFVARGPLWLRTLTPFVTAGIVFAVGVVAYRGTRREEESTALVEHTHEVIDGNQAVLARVIDAETGERGYIITGDERYLTPYEGARSDARGTLARLRNLVADDPKQLARVDTLGALVERRLSSLRVRVEARQRGGFVAAREAIAIGGGEAAMDSIRTMARTIETGELRLLDERHANAVAHARSVLVVIVAATAAAIAIAFVLNLMLSRYAASQERLARRLEEENRLREAQAVELEASRRLLEDHAIELEETHDQLLERTQEAEDANKAKSDFLARMSHELRTPLNAIGGYVDLMELGLRGPVTDAQLSDLARIKRSGRHLLGLIDNVLSFSKIEAGHLPLKLERLRLRDVLTEIEPFVAPQIDAKGLSFSLETPPPNVYVVADREKLDQILINLLTNAYKFTPTGGRVSVASETLGGLVRIHVCDTGRGIPADKLETIFDPFVQVDHGRGDAGGVGLGLAITRELVGAMGGDLSAKSTPGAGSTFTLTLPMAGGRADES